MFRRTADSADIVVGVLQCLQVDARLYQGRRALSGVRRPRSATPRGSACGPDPGGEDRGGRTANETAARLCVQIEGKL